MIESLRDKERGFTLVELLLVVMILGLLAAVVSISVVGLMGKGEEEAYDTDERTIQLAVATFYADDHAYDSDEPSGGWNEASGYDSVHNYPTNDGRYSALEPEEQKTEINGYDVWKITGFTGSTEAEKRLEIADAAIWMGLLVNGPGEGTGIAPVNDTKGNSAPLANEHGPYLNPLP
ncbi:MAG: type II secretion system protein [Dehalococcoidia bacterium]|nr:MAG: type II secretion system protein [Dehalococcoidia bacterium]